MVETVTFAVLCLCIFAVVIAASIKSNLKFAINLSLCAFNITIYMYSYLVMRQYFVINFGL